MQIHAHEESALHMAQRVANATNTITSRPFATILKSMTRAVTVQAENSTEKKEENQRKFMQFLRKHYRVGCNLN